MSVVISFLTTEEQSKTEKLTVQRTQVGFDTVDEIYFNV